ncbi:hypothetical protein GCK32_017871, partial [Trichostrongylus colubriformis]
MMGLVYSYRDTGAYFYSRQVRSLLNIKTTSPYGPQSFSSIRQIHQFWNWTQSTLAPGSLYLALSATWYDGFPAWRMRGFANDKVSRQMGIGHIRQIRSMPLKECYTEPQLGQYFNNCNSDFSP